MDSDDDIAIVGVGCKVPGADNIEEFWKVLYNGENHVKVIPNDRWNKEAFSSEDMNSSGKTYAKHAGLVKNFTQWDNKCFGINDTEAKEIDPQQRYVLECVHMALEDGGITRKSIKGVMNDDYKGIGSDDLKSMSNYTLTGASMSLIAARVSYVYDLSGQSMCIDTACSSSLVAIDVGIKYLKSDSTSMVICGGVNSILSPDLFVALSQAKMLSPTGQCRAFSENADGYARGEGCGIVILKKLKQAKEDGNKIWGVIATACNQDGQNVKPISAPSQTQQEKLLKSIYAHNKVNPHDIQVIEAHGTGTAKGDPIEANSLGKILGRSSFPETNTVDRPVYIGSVKTNIGHLESAAGIAGLVKMLLMMKNRIIVPSLHLIKANPMIDFDRFNFCVPTSNLEWNCHPPKRRMGCINSFGFGGTNAHAIVKEYCGNKEVKQEMEKTCLLFHSAMTPDGLYKAIETLIGQLGSTGDSLQSISYTSLCRRDHYQYRAAFYGISVVDIQKTCIERIKQNFKPRTSRTNQHIVAVFCGVGTEWQGMCRELMIQEEVVYQTIDNIDEHLKKYTTEFSVFNILLQGRKIYIPLQKHIAIFACQVALWNLWIHWGIEIDAIIGQSVGEVAASYAAGALSLEEAVKIMYYRSLHLSKVTAGKMFVVGNCNINWIKEVCSIFPQKTSIAVQHSPVSCTLSCDNDIIHVLKDALQNKCPTIIFHDLNVPCGYHSHHTRKAATDLENTLDYVTASTPSIPLMSTVTGQWVDPIELRQPSYWRKNVCETVLFYDAVKGVGKNEFFNIFLEIGPSPVLSSHISDCYSKHDAICFPSVKRDREIETITSTIARLFEEGVDLNWNKIHKGQRLISNIPTYVFVKKDGLFRSEATQLKHNGLDCTQSSHMFVSRTGKSKFKLTVTPESTPFVYTHIVSDEKLIPGTFYAEAAAEIGHQLTKHKVEDMTFSIEYVRTVRVSENQMSSIAVYIADDSDEHNTYGIIRNNKDIVARFSSRATTRSLNPGNVDIQNIRHYCTDYNSKEEIYDNLLKSGFEYGSELQMIEEVYTNKDQCLVKLCVSDEIWSDVKRTHLHPSILDALFQSVIVLKKKEQNAGFLPTGIGELLIRKRPEKNMYGFVQRTNVSTTENFFNLLLIGEDAKVIAIIKDFKIQNVNLKTSFKTTTECQLIWREIEYLPLQKLMKINEKPENYSLVFCFNGKLVESIMPANLNEKILVRDIYNISGLRQVVQSALSQKERVGNVFFIPGLRYDEQMRGPDIYEIVRQSCRGLLVILQCIAKLKIHVPVTVLTESCQFLDGLNGEACNILGSELWGQVRSILREETDITIHLIDIQPSLLEAKEFIKCLLVDAKDMWPKKAELVYRKGRLFTSIIKENEPKTWLYRNSFFDNGGIVQLKSRNPNSLSDMFYALYSKDRIENSQRNANGSNPYIMIHAIEFCQHSRHVHPLVLRNETKRLVIWPETEANGFDVVSFEAVGYLCENGDVCKCLDFSKNHVKCIVCFPFTIKTHLFVPQCCVYPIADIPDYKYGILSVSVLLWELKTHIQANQVVTILCQSKHSCVGRLLQLLLEQYITNVRADVTELPYIDSHADVLIPLISLDVPTIESILQQDSLNYLLVFESFLHQDLKVHLETGNFKVQIIKVEHVFMKSKIQETAPDVFFWLSKNLPIALTNTVFDNDSVFPLPSKTILVDRKNIVKVKAPVGTPFRKDCSYIIVGGLSGLGWVLLNVLAKHGAGQVISLSRRQITQEKQNQLNELNEATGCKFKTFAVDITQLDELRPVFNEIKTKHFQIKGIFQGAGVIDDKMFFEMSEEKLNVLRPKVLGTWNLHLMSTQFPLDYFVVQSSITAVFGNPGQSNYGAGNSFMDCLVYFRRQQGTCGQTINWGPLNVGMTTETPELENILKEAGYFLLSDVEIESVFLKILDSPLINIIAGKFDWNRIGRNLSSASIGDKLTIQRFQLALTERSNTVAKCHTTDHLSKDDIQKRNTQLVFEITSEICGIEIERLSMKTLIQNLGMDSLQSMRFARNINQINGNTLITALYLLSHNVSVGNIVAQLNETSNIPLREKKSPHITESKITPMEKSLYKEYEKNPFDPSLVIYVDLEVSQNLSDPDKWQNLLRNVMHKHPALRTLFVKKEGIVQKKIVDIKKITLPFKVVGKTEINHVEHLPPNRKLFYFDPEKDLPCRLLFAYENDFCLIRFVFSHLCIDFTSAEMILQDFLRSEESMLQDPSSSTDVAILVEGKRQKVNVKLEEFWKWYTPDKPPSMNINKSCTDLDPQCFDFTKVTVDPETVFNLKSFLTSHNIRLFDFTTSLFQLLLHTILKQDVISIFTDIDMRIHFPQLDRKVGKFTMSVPLFTTIDKNLSVLEYIKRGKDLNIRVLEYSLLPFEEILELTGLNITDTFAHSIIMEDKSQWKLLQENEQYDIRVKRILTGDYNHEFGLLVWYDIEDNGNLLELELSYNTKAVDKPFSLLLLKDLRTFITSAIKTPNMKIKELHLLIKDDCQMDLQPVPEETTSILYIPTDDTKRKRKKAVYSK
ncbi:Probable polyketide synthase 1 [Mytilus coruscus]|uniref:Probable polyketide synthase 1 n=1 Tax=Mytilus coruscus TaxID=42192 RepID=A0A6J8EL91_MYTCO|nr:Probable polyketide synthase 1 [Mytilus coruscus]